MPSNAAHSPHSQEAVPDRDCGVDLVVKQLVWKGPNRVEPILVKPGLDRVEPILVKLVSQLMVLDHLQLPLGQTPWKGNHQDLRKAYLAVSGDLTENNEYAAHGQTQQLVPQTSVRGKSSTSAGRYDFCGQTEKARYDLSFVSYTSGGGTLQR